MHDKAPTPTTTTCKPARDVGRRAFLKLGGDSLLALGMPSILNNSFAKAQDMSKSANNFYSSDAVTLQKATFKNQYQMSVAGNLLIPRNMDRNAKLPAIVVGHPMGA